MKDCHNRQDGFAMIAAALILSMAIIFFASIRTVDAAAPLELAVYPSKAFGSVGISSKVMIGVKGLAGFSGITILSFSGLPSGSYVSCGSNCDPATPSAQDMAPFEINVASGEWRTIGPIIFVSPTDPGTYTVTITATTSGQSDVSQTILFKQMPLETATVGCEDMPSPANRQTVTAGESVSYTCTMQVLGNLDSWMDGTEVTFRSNIDEPGSPFDDSIITSYDPAKRAFSVGEKVSVTLNVETSTVTPSGVYAFGMGIARDDGYYEMGRDAVLTVVNNGATASETTTIETTAPPQTSDASDSVAATADNLDSATEQLLVPASEVGATAAILTLGALAAAATSGGISLLSWISGLLLALAAISTLITERLGLPTRGKHKERFKNQSKPSHAWLISLHRVILAVTLLVATWNLFTMPSAKTILIASAVAILVTVDLVILHPLRHKAHSTKHIAQNT